MAWRQLCVLSFLLVASVAPSSAFLPLFHNPLFSVDIDKAAGIGKGKAGGGEPPAIGSRKGDANFAKTNWPGKWELFLQNSGVSAMHMMLLPQTNTVQIYDATVWRISQIKLPPNVPCHFVADRNLLDCWAHSVNLDVNTGALRGLRVETDTWCSSGALTVNGTMISTGGFQAGANSARYLGNCDNCEWIENPAALAAQRWYSTQATLPDGSFIVVGGRNSMNYEYIPPSGIPYKKLYDFPLLRETLDVSSKNLPVENNLYPFVWLSTDGNLFIFANNRSVLLNPKTNKIVREFPVLPGGARNYPATGFSALLPIRLHVNNRPVIPAEVLICGGAPHNAYELAGQNIFVDSLRDCGRLRITSTNPKWKLENMPMPRIMGDTVVLPNGEVLITNGAKKGSAGWNFAQDPVFEPVLYSPYRKRGFRFRTLAPTTIPRMYHSTAILLPDTKVLVAGSNTHDGYIYNAQYPTELRVEKFSPPYLDPLLDPLRPEIVAASTPKQIKYGEKFVVEIKSKRLVVEKENLKVTMFAPAFSTHSMSMNQRLIMLGISDVKNHVSLGVHAIEAVAPPSGNIAPPGYYLLFAVYRGVPSAGEWIQIV